MSSIAIASIVEGHGEVAAAPLLIRRVAERIDPNLYVVLPPPVRIKRDRIAERFDDLARAIGYAIGLLQGPGGILVLLDAEDDCPKDLGPNLLQRAQAPRSDIPVGVALAKYEFESWFLAAAESIRGKRDLPDDLAPPLDPEGIARVGCAIECRLGESTLNEPTNQPSPRSLTWTSRVHGPIPSTNATAKSSV